MMRSLLAFEWRYHTRQVSYLAAIVLLVGLALVMVNTGFGPENLQVNSPWVVTYSLGFMFLVSIFVITVLSANAVLRDSEHQMTEIILATPVGRWTWLLTRFAGVVLATFTVFLLATVVLMLAPLVLPVEPERLGPVRWMPYAWALLTVVLPNIVVATALLFVVAVGTRNTLATWVGGLVIYALYLLTSMLVGSPLMAGSGSPTTEALARAAMLDPFGLSAFFEQTRYWTPVERNTRLVSLQGHFLLNRVTWLGVAAAVVALTARLFRMRTTARKAARTETVDDALPAPVVVRPAVTLAPAGSIPWRAIASTIRLDLRHVLGSRPAIALLLLWVFFTSVEIPGQTASEYGTRLYPTTALMLDAISQPLTLLGTLVLIFFGAELAFRARGHAMDELLDVTPAGSVVFYLGHLVALALLALALTALSVGIAVTFQLLRGYHDLQLPVYASLFWTATVPLVLMAALILLLQALSPNRYVGMLLSVMVFVLLQSDALPALEHPLVRYGGAPAVTWSGLSGYTSTAWSFGWFTLYWAMVATVLAVIAVAVWRRGRDASLLRRLARIPATLGRRGLAATGALLFATGAMGGFIYYQTSIRQRYVSRADMRQWRAEYERAYRTRIGSIAPEVTAVTTDVALFPSERRLTASGSLALENRSGSTMDTVWVSLRREARDVTLALDGAPPVVSDSAFGMYAFAPADGLVPGGSAQLTFSLALAEPRLRAAGFDESLAPNGTFMFNQRLLPAPGYRETYEILDPGVRRRLGLAEREPSDSTTPSWITFEATISTASDQVAVAPGTLEREWEQDGRRFFHYRHASPMVNRFALASARYAVKRQEHNGVMIEVYYHPSHDANVDRMTTAVATSLDLFTEQFGPYGEPVIRIVEVPSTWGMGAAVAFPGTIFFVEDRGFLTNASDSTRLDIVTRRVAHEVAHQWWGVQLYPANAPGATMLVESFAKYGEQRVLARTHGEASVEELLLFDQDRYLAGRTGAEADEVPLLQSGSEQWLYYGKGGVVMNAIRALVGEEALGHAMARLLEQHGGPGGHATTADFLAILREEAPVESHAQLDEWLGEVVLYDLAIPAASAESVQDGKYRTTVEVKASKVKGDQAGPLNEAVDIAMYGDSLLYSGEVFLSGRDTTLTFTLDVPPTRVVIDPWVRRLDRDRSDNERKVTR